MFGPSTSACPQYAIASVGIEPRGLGERAGGFRMVEAVGQVQALVHEELRALHLRGHRERVDAEVLQPRRERRARRRRLVEAWRLSS